MRPLTEDSDPRDEDAATVLFLAQLPPPRHGVTTTSERVLGVLESMDDVEVDHIWMGGAAGLSDLGRKSFKKIVLFLVLVTRLLGLWVVGKRYTHAYLTFAPWAHTAIRDAVLAGLCKLLARRTLVHLHVEGLADILDGTTLRNRVIRRLLNGTELIAITEDTVRLARMSNVFSRVLPMANTVPDPGPRDGTPGSALVFGWFGNFDGRKGVLRFIDVVAALVAAGLPVGGRLAGSPSRDLSVADLKRYIAARGAEGHIHVLRTAGQAEKAAFFAGLDVFFYPTRHDHAPLVLLEALSHGVAPVVFDQGGIREMLGRQLAANVLPPFESEAGRFGRIEAIVRGYLGDRRRLVADKRAARERYLSRFSELRFRQRLIRILLDPPASAARAAPVGAKAGRRLEV